MRGQSGSSLNVSLKSVHDESEVLIYNLVGYHGDTWSEAQVSWTETRTSKVTKKIKGKNALRSFCKDQRKTMRLSIYLTKYAILRSCSEALQTVLMNLPLASMTWKFLPATVKCTLYSLLQVRHYTQEYTENSANCCSCRTSKNTTDLGLSNFLHSRLWTVQKMY